MPELITRKAASRALHEAVFGAQTSESRKAEAKPKKHPVAVKAVAPPSARVSRAKRPFQTLSFGKSWAFSFLAIFPLERCEPVAVSVPRDDRPRRRKGQARQLRAARKSRCAVLVMDRQRFDRELTERCSGRTPAASRAFRHSRQAVSRSRRPSLSVGRGGTSIPVDTSSRPHVRAAVSHHVARRYAAFGALERPPIARRRDRAPAPGNPSEHPSAPPATRPTASAGDRRQRD